MTIKPWMTSRTLIESVKRKIAIPINQRTFTDDDILAFASEELVISQVPDIMQYHEEYFVFNEDVPLLSNKVRYAIPERALGQKFRDIFYKDDNGNLFEMTRINPDDKAYWQNESGSNNVMQKYWLEGTEVVLSHRADNFSPTGSLQFSYFLRPNQLVVNERAAICNAFFKEVIINNATLVAGDTITVGSLVFTAVVGLPSALEFQIGTSSILTAGNIATAINTNGTYKANNGSPSSNVLTIIYSTLSTPIETSNPSALNIDTNIGIRFTQDLPDNIIEGTNIDFLQTKPGHRTYKLSVLLPPGSVSDNTIKLSADVIPEAFIVGDYICQEYECIIPQIPSDLHNGLAERVCGRILSAQGDMQGLQMTGAKLQDIQRTEGILLDNRVDGSTQKIGQRKSLLSFLRLGVRRRF